MCAFCALKLRHCRSDHLSWGRRPRRSSQYRTSPSRRSWSRTPSGCPEPSETSLDGHAVRARTRAGVDSRQGALGVVATDAGLAGAFLAGSAGAVAGPAAAVRRATALVCAAPVASADAAVARVGRRAVVGGWTAGLAALAARLARLVDARLPARTRNPGLEQSSPASQTPLPHLRTHWLFWHTLRAAPHSLRGTRRSSRPGRRSCRFRTPLRRPLCTYRSGKKPLPRTGSLRCSCRSSRRGLTQGVFHTRVTHCPFAQTFRSHMIRRSGPRRRRTGRSRTWCRPGRRHRCTNRRRPRTRAG